MTLASKGGKVPSRFDNQECYDRMWSTKSNEVTLTIYNGDIDSIGLSILTKRTFQQRAHSDGPKLNRSFQRGIHSNSPPAPTTIPPTCKNCPAYYARCLVKDPLPI